MSRRPPSTPARLQPFATRAFHGDPTPRRPSLRGRIVRRTAAVLATVAVVASLVPAFGGTSIDSISLACDPTAVGVPARCRAILTLAGIDGSAFTARIGVYDNEQGGQPSSTEAVDRARRFDVITATPYQYRANVVAMKAANPDLQLNVYVNGTHTRSTSLPEGQYCHDAEGSRITSTGTWSGNILMDPASAGWRNTLISNAESALATSGYDGVFLDVMGRGTMSYNVTGACIDVRTGQAYTAADWERDTSLLAKAVKDAVGRRVQANGASRGMTYFGSPSSSVVAQYVDAGLAEGFTRNGAFFEGFYTESQLVKDIDMVAETAAMQVLAKDWRSVSQDVKDQEMRYAFGTFLLATDGNDVFGWTGSRSSWTQFDPLWELDLGTPRGPYFATGGGRYRRDFARGHVIVDTAAHTADFVTTGVGAPSVRWESSAAGTFEPQACVQRDATSLLCEASYVPARGSQGTHSISVSATSEIGTASVASTSIEVTKRASGTTLVCSSPVTFPEPARCRVTVEDTSGGDRIPPSGDVAVSLSDGTSVGTCSLGDVSGFSSCSLEYASGVTGTAELTAAYGGGPDHRPSSSSTAIIRVEDEPVVPEPPVDVTAPTIEITSPTDGTALARGVKVSLAATATDDTGIARVVFEINGSAKCTLTEPEWTCQWTPPKGKTGAFTIVATVFDAAGNSSSDQISVTTVKG